MKNLFIITLSLMMSYNSFAQTTESTDINDASEEEKQEYYKQLIDSISGTLNYQYGIISLTKNGTELAKLQVPEGYKYLSPEQTQYVMTDLWGNPPSEELGLGMLIPKDLSPIGDDFTFGVEIDYSDEGYIKDEDAEGLDYKDLLKQMQSDSKEANKQRIAQGYEPVELVGWATSPYYDSNNKKLYWAKELKFGENPINTLNYNIRVLGRGGYINLNAIGDMDVLPLFEKDLNAVLGSVNFVDGQKYSDYNSSLDKVAAYGIGGLIAGKVLAKTGILVLLLKFWKLIALGIGVAFLGIKKFFSKEDPAVSDSDSYQENT